MYAVICNKSPDLFHKKNLQFSTQKKRTGDRKDGNKIPIKIHTTGHFITDLQYLCLFEKNKKAHRNLKKKNNKQTKPAHVLCKKGMRVFDQCYDSRTFTVFTHNPVCRGEKV